MKTDIERALERLPSPEVQAAFAIDLARTKAMQGLVAEYGRTAVLLSWAFGYHTGFDAGLERIQEQMGWPK